MAKRTGISAAKVQKLVAKDNETFRLTNEYDGKYITEIYYGNRNKKRKLRPISKHFLKPNPNIEFNFVE